MAKELKVKAWAIQKRDGSLLGFHGPLVSYDKKGATANIFRETDKVIPVWIVERKEE